MPPLPYSQSLWRAPNFSGNRQPLYTVPPGRRAVIKSITTVWGVVELSGLDVWLEDDAGCKIYRVFRAPGGTTSGVNNGMDLAFGSWVFLDGETVYGSTDMGQCDLQGSGYELLIP